MTVTTRPNLTYSNIAIARTPWHPRTTDESIEPRLLDSSLAKTRKTTEVAKSGFFATSVGFSIFRPFRLVSEEAERIRGEEGTGVVLLEVEPPDAVVPAKGYRTPVEGHSNQTVVSSLTCITISRELSDVPKPH